MATASIVHQHRWIERGRARAEARRRFVVKLVLMIYCLALLEGPLRKWLLPDFATEIYFLRDPFVIFLYAYCLQHGLFHLGGMGRALFGFAAVASVLGLLPFFINDLSPLGWVLGVRTYFIYLPLAFIVAANFDREDIQRFLRWNILLAVPYAVLVIYQYNAPATAWVNHGIAGDDSAAVGLGEGIVRPFGLFTYGGQSTSFTASMVAMFLAFVLLGARRTMRMPVLLAGALSVSAMAVLTGSRSIYFLVASIAAVTIVGAYIAKPGSRALRASIAVVILAVLAGTLFVNLFPDMYAAMEGRFERAERSEGSIWLRAFGGFMGAFDALWTAPLLGYGIGTGTPGIAKYLNLPLLIHGEGDLQRNINELGIFLGFALVVLRFTMVGYVGRSAVITARLGQLAALPLAGYAMIEIAVGQITHSPLSGFQPWLIAGLVLALGANAQHGVGHARLYPERALSKSA